MSTVYLLIFISICIAEDFYYEYDQSFDSQILPSENRLGPPIYNAGSIKCASFCSVNNNCSLIGINTTNKSCFLFGYEGILDISGTPGQSHLKHYVKARDGRCMLKYGYIVLREVDMCVKVYTESLSHPDASDRCQSDGGRLVVLEDQDKGDAVLSLLVDKGLSDAIICIGLTRDPADSSHFIWEDGRSLSRDWWHPSDPNGEFTSENCGGIVFGQLVDMPCAYPPIAGFVCEIP